MKLLLKNFTKVVQKKLDEHLMDIQQGGVACGVAPGQQELNGFIMGVKATNVDVDTFLIEVPKYFEKYFVTKN